MSILFFSFLQKRKGMDHRQKVSWKHLFVYFFGEFPCNFFTASKTDMCIRYKPNLQVFFKKRLLDVGGYKNTLSQFVRENLKG